MRTCARRSRSHSPSQRAGSRRSKWCWRWVGSVSAAACRTSSVRSISARTSGMPRPSRTRETSRSWSTMRAMRRALRRTRSRWPRAFTSSMRRSARVAPATTAPRGFRRSWPSTATNVSESRSVRFSSAMSCSRWRLHLAAVPPLAVQRVDLLGEEREPSLALARDEPQHDERVAAREPGSLAAEALAAGRGGERAGQRAAAAEAAREVGGEARIADHVRERASLERRRGHPRAAPLRRRSPRRHSPLARGAGAGRAGSARWHGMRPATITPAGIRDPRPRPPDPRGGDRR